MIFFTNALEAAKISYKTTYYDHLPGKANSQPVVSVEYVGEIGEELKTNWKKTIRGSKNLRYKVYRPNFNVLERKFPVVNEFIPSCD